MGPIVCFTKSDFLFALNAAAQVSGDQFSDQAVKRVFFCESPASPTTPLLVVSSRGTSLNSTSICVSIPSHDNE